MTSVTTDRRQGISASAAIKAPVRAATTANITLSGEQTIDGVACVTNDRVLVKDQTDASTNGIWTVDTGAWSRAPDFDGTYDIVRGTLVPVTDGTVNGPSFWQVTANNPITIGTTLVTFALRVAALGGVSAFMQTVLDDTDSAAARATLGAQADLDVPTQAEAEAGTATTERVWTAQRVGQLAMAFARGLGQCRLTRSSATALLLNPHNGNLLFINGRAEIVPSAGVTVSNSGLAANTNYFVYAFMNAGVMTLELSTSLPATDSTYGHRIKTGDATRSYVGNTRTTGDTPGQFPAALFGGPSIVRSWFNPIHYIHQQYVFADSIGGSNLATPSAQAWPFTPITAAQMPGVQLPGLLKLEFAQYRWLYSSTNTGDILYAVHADDGPANVTTIATRVSLGAGGVANETDIVTSALQGLQQNGIIYKNLGWQYSASAASTFTIYQISLEMVWSIQDARE